LRNLQKKFGKLHDEGLTTPLADKKGIGLLMATRHWEPVGFTQLRRLRTKE
jgi:hypothetical protein